MPTNHVPLRYANLLPILLLIATGAQFRSWGITLDFWGDEAWWASRLHREPITDVMFRPVGYMWLCKQLGTLVGNDLWFRLPSYLASIGTLIIIYLASGQIYKNRITCLTILFISALHPKLIVFAKEFKPYSTEIFLHCFLLYWALRCSRARVFPLAFFVACIASIPFCYNIIFLFPGLLWLLVAEQAKAMAKNIP